jgi:tripartite-type tricarboxylate transporter receptor subunit TctC
MNFSVLRRVSFLGLGALCVASLVAVTSAHAQTPGAAFPNKPIRVVVPFPAGGAIDTFVRTIGPELERQLGQTIVVFNKPGGGSQIAASDVLLSPADGHTVFVGQIGDFTVNPLLYKNINYIPSRDFEPVTMLVRAPQVMLANTGGKISTVKSLKETMANPSGLVTYGSFGPGTAPHLLGHILSKQASGAKFTHVPYKGFPPAMQALMTQEVDLLFDAVPGTLNMMKTGKVVPLAVAGTQRNSLLPDVPTTAEIGFPTLVMDFWIGAVVKKGTSATIVNKLSDAFQRAVASPENLKRFNDLGYVRVATTPAEFESTIRSETEKIKPVIIETGVSID